MKKVVVFLAAAALLLSLLPVGAAAEEEKAEYDGYLLCLREGYAALFSELPDGIEAVAPEIGLYRAETLEDAAYFSPEEVRHIEPNYLVFLLDEEETAGRSWNLTMLGADTAGLAGLDGSGVRIGVVDSGLYADHEVLAGARVIPGRNYIEESGNTSDNVGHGTFVTGIITAAAPGVEVVPLKCFDNRTSRVDHIIAAIRSGVDDYGCDILNMSFGLISDSVFLREAVEYAAEKGLVMVAAVGNDGTMVKNYPAAYESVIGVGMVGSDKIVAEKSQRNDSVLLTAPGVDIMGPEISGPSAYRTGSGTSYACPHAAAAAALVWQAAPEMTAGELRTALAESAEDLGEPGYDEAYGCGLLSVAAALAGLPLKAVRTEEGLRLRAVRTGADSWTQAWAAGYNSEGQLLNCCLLSAAAAGDALAVNDVFLFVEGMEQVRIFFLRNGTMEPVMEMESAGVW